MKMIETSVGSVVVKFGTIKVSAQNLRNDRFFYTRGDGVRDVTLCAPYFVTITAGLTHPVHGAPHVASMLPHRTKVVFFLSLEHREMVWGLASEYQAAEAEIAARKTYRVTRITFFNNEPTTNSLLLMGEGTIPQLENRIGRLAELPPTMMAFEYRYIYEVQDGKVWRPCRKPGNEKVSHRPTARVVPVVPKEVVNASELVGLVWLLNQAPQERELCEMQNGS